MLLLGLKRAEGQFQFSVKTSLVQRRTTVGVNFAGRPKSKSNPDPFTGKEVVSPFVDYMPAFYSILCRQRRRCASCIF